MQIEIHGKVGITDNRGLEFIPLSDSTKLWNENQLSHSENPENLSRHNAVSGYTIMCTHEIPPKVAKRFIPISGKWKSTNESRLATVLNILIPCCTGCTIYPHIVQS